MTSARLVAVVVGTAIAMFLENAFGLAAAGEAEATLGGPPASAGRSTSQQTNPPGAPARTRRWSAHGRPRVSAGVLVRAASRKPLDRGACAPPATRRDDGGSTGEGKTRAPEEPCPQSGPRKGEHIEVDWHGDPATP